MRCRYYEISVWDISLDDRYIGYSTDCGICAWTKWWLIKLNKNYKHQIMTVR